QQHPCHVGLGDDPAPEDGARLSHIPVPLGDAFHALETDRVLPHAVRADVPVAQPAPDVGLPARMPVTGGNGRGGRFGTGRGAHTARAYLRSIVTDWRTTGSSGLSIWSVATSEMATTTSLPSTTSPKIVCRPLSQSVVPTVMKNWDPLLFGPALAIASR